MVFFFFLKNVKYIAELRASKEGTLEREIIVKIRYILKLDRNT